jgi:hypothetical protein
VLGGDCRAAGTRARPPWCLQAPGQPPWCHSALRLCRAVCSCSLSRYTDADPCGPAWAGAAEIARLPLPAITFLRLDKHGKPHFRFEAGCTRAPTRRTGSCTLAAAHLQAPGVSLETPCVRQTTIAHTDGPAICPKSVVPVCLRGWLVILEVHTSVCYYGARRYEEAASRGSQGEGAGLLQRCAVARGEACIHLNAVQSAARRLPEGQLHSTSALHNGGLHSQNEPLSEHRAWPSVPQVDHARGRLEGPMARGHASPCKPSAAVMRCS